MNFLISFLCVTTGLFSAYILNEYIDTKLLKSIRSEKFIYFIFTGIIVCSQTLSYALFVVWNIKSSGLLVVTVLNILITILIWIIFYLKKSKKLIFISATWNVLMCCYMVYLFYISFVKIN